jgi:hypothetical protein
MQNGWQTPLLSVLTGADKDALQRIFSSLQVELSRLQGEIDLLKSGNSSTNKERTRY